MGIHPNATPPSPYSLSNKWRDYQTTSTPQYNPLIRPYFLVETHGIFGGPNDTIALVTSTSLDPATRWRNFFVAIRLAVDVMKRAQVTRHQIGWMKLIEHQDVGPDQNVGSDISKKQEKTVAWELRKNFLCVDVYIHISNNVTKDALQTTLSLKRGCKFAANLCSYWKLPPYSQSMSM